MLEPLRFEPVFREYLWGGRRLGETLAKPIGHGDSYAESWEVVDHQKDQSIVSGGPLSGSTLREVFASNQQALMGRHQGFDRFPLLLKYLDCNRVLSVQVHPDDAFAAGMSPPDLGKTEAWYIVAAEPDAVIYAGLKQGVQAQDLAEACANNQTADLLHTLRPQAGDCVFIPAGTVHALGAGLLVAEIQQSSDTTFRLFDWNRVDAAGHARPLHIQQAIEVTDYQRGPVHFQSAQSLSNGGERLVRCDHFVLDRYAGARSFQIDADDRFHILTTVSGAAKLLYEQGTLDLALGQSVLVPASVQSLQIQGSEESTVVLSMYLP